MANKPTTFHRDGLSANFERLANWCSGGTPSRSRAEYFGRGIQWIKSGDLPDGPITKTEEQITELGLQNSAAKVLPEGTVSMALYGATIGKLGVFTFEGATNQACANVIPNANLIHNLYLFYFLLSERRNFIDLAQGGAQPNISQQIVRDYPLRLAPLAEQRRIVAALEAILAKVANCQARLARVPTILKRFRQAILAAACSGRLTAEFQTPEKAHETGSDVRRRLASERYRSWNVALTNGTTARRRKTTAYKEAASIAQTRPARHSATLVLGKFG